MTPVTADQYDALRRDLTHFLASSIKAWAAAIPGVEEAAFDADGFYGLLGTRPEDVASCALLGGLGIHVGSDLS